MYKKCRSFSVLLVALTVLLGGCSSNLAYNNLDWLVGWYVEDHVDLNYQQKKTLGTRLEQLLQWHRSQELSQYRALLVQLQDDINHNKLTSEQWLTYLVVIRSHWLRTRDKVGLQMSEMAPELSVIQVADLFNNMQQKNVDKEEEFKKLSDEDVQQERFDDLYDVVEDQLGSVNTAQEHAVKRYVQQSQSTVLEYVVYNKNIQQAAYTLFENGFINSSDSTYLLQRLYQLLIHPQQYQSIELQEMIKSNRALSADLLQQIQANITPNQQSHLNDNVHEWIELLDDLIKEE